MTNLSDYRRNFYQIYHKEILPKLMNFEKERKQRFHLVILIDIVILCITGYIAKIMATPSIIITIGVALIILITHLINKKFIKQVKSHCMHDMTKVFGEVEWQPETDIITNEQLNNSELFASFNRRSSDDAFKGVYKDVPFSISETYLIHQTGSGKNKRVKTVFKGVIINVASNKPIKAKTIIATKNDYQLKRNLGLWSMIFCFLPLLVYCFFTPNADTMIIYLTLAMFGIAILAIALTYKQNEQMEEIKLEDPVFTKRFKVYSADEVEARYLITTAFMERFTKLNTSFGSKKAKCSFYNDSIMFAISTNKNIFEMGSIFKRLDNPKQITIFFEEISSILMLIDYFKLNEHIGL